MILLVTNNKGSMLEPIFLQVASNIPTNENEQSQKIQMFVFLILKFWDYVFWSCFSFKVTKKTQVSKFFVLHCPT